jgi:serine/threonine protein phosphatase PrpC
MKTAIASVAGGSANQDRAIVITVDEGVVIALADGAGGLGNGARAAQAWIDAVAANPTRADWVGALEELDADSGRRGAGQTTAIVVEVTGDSLRGACVGDSAGWLVVEDEVIDLAEHVPAKPLVGDGCMASEIVSRPFTTGTLLVASDGLVRYADRPRIAAIAHDKHLEAAAKALIELVRLPSGRLPDDVTVVLARRW